MDLLRRKIGSKALAFLFVTTSSILFPTSSVSAFTTTTRNKLPSRSSSSTTNNNNDHDNNNNFKVRETTTTHHHYHHTLFGTATKRGRRRRGEYDYYDNNEGYNNNNINHNEDRPSHKHDDDDYFDFDALSDFSKRLKAFELLSVEALMTFYEPHLMSFSVKPGTAKVRSITSTCYALLAILQGGSGSYNTHIEYERRGSTTNTDQKEEGGGKINLPTLLDALITGPWRSDDLFQESLILLVLFKAKKYLLLSDHNNTNETSMLQKIESLLNNTLNARPCRRNGADQKLSEYISYLCCQTYASAQELILEDMYSSSSTSTNTTTNTLLSTLAIEKGSATSLALARSSESSLNELCKQLSYRTANDYASFDIIRMAYSLMSYIKSTEALEGVAGIELIPGAGSSSNTRPISQNTKLIVAALDAFFREQNADGLWAQGQPIYKSFRKQNRQIGNAFVFTVDTVASLLEILPAELFRPHLSALQRMLDYIESNLEIELIPEYCTDGQCYGSKSIKGWSSPHLPPNSSPQAWSTAQVVTCIHHMRSTIRTLRNKDVLTDFDGIQTPQRNDDAWDRLLDSDIGNGDGGCRTIKSVMEERVIQPFANGADNPSVGVAYSTILFGPPGTAKTTICESLAQRMGWDFVVIDTTAFLANGSSNIASTIRYVFKRLMALKECVILFDEIEEFCLDRNTPGLSMESRMLTTAMLTAINDLRRTKQSIFFLATNRLTAFDSAIIRPGRFDMQLYVGPPNLQSKVLQLTQKIRIATPTTTNTNNNDNNDDGDEDDHKSPTADAILVYENYLKSVWEDAMFMNYLEGNQFAESCAAIINNNNSNNNNDDNKPLLTKEELDLLFKQQAAVMTVRGPVRDEYITMMELSRM